MFKPRLVELVLLAGMMFPGAAMVSAQDFPHKPIRIVTTPPGGGGDFASRLIAQGISGPLGQPVIVDNRQTLVIGELVKNAPPDGYTVLYNGSGFMFRPLLEKMPYDAIKDFSPITITAKAPLVLVVNPSVPANSVKELIALAKAKPGTLNHATTNPGGGIHVAAELFKSMAGVNMVGVFYKASAQGFNAVMSGEVQVMFADATAVAAQAKSGKLRPLAVTSPEPSLVYPGLPTVAASGLPGYDMVGIDGMWAPAGTPAAVINRLNQAIVRTLNTADVKEKFLSTGTEVVGSSPEQAAVAMKYEIAKTAKVLRDAGIKVE